MRRLSCHERAVCCCGRPASHASHLVLHGSDYEAVKTRTGPMLNLPPSAPMLTADRKSRAALDRAMPQCRPAVDCIS